MYFLDEVLVGAIQIVVVLLLTKYLPSYFSEKGKNLATKEDVTNITNKIEEVKSIYKISYDLSKKEREFYQGMIDAIYLFQGKLKNYNLENCKEATKEIFLSDPTLKDVYLSFIDSANAFVGNSYVFLKDKNYSQLKSALETSNNFTDLTNNLLDAMRKSLHPDSSLSPARDLKEFKY